MKTEKWKRILRFIRHIFYANNSACCMSATLHDNLIKMHYFTHFTDKKTNLERLFVKNCTPKTPRCFFFYQETDTFHFPGGSVVNNSAALQETWVQSLGQEDPLEKEMATRSCILVWEVLWTEEPVGLLSMGSQRVGHNWATEHTRACRQIPKSKFSPERHPPSCHPPLFLF